MAIKPILTIGHRKLTMRSKKVNHHTDLSELERDLIDSVDWHGGIGLSAIQIGVPLRVFVAEGRLYVNPEVVKVSDDWVCGTEGCLSIPGYAADVWRHGAIIIKAQDRSFHRFKVRLDDWSARVVQHELDHLDGKLILDANHVNFRKVEQEVGSIVQ